jgi:CxxC-x17-CxxC domain-containing protein
MNNFKGGGFNKGGPKFGGKNKFGSDRGHRGSGNRERNERGGDGPGVMFTATCSECGNKCEVPFKPSGDKPVYCSTCFGAKKNANESRGSINSKDRSDKGLRDGGADYQKKPRDQRSPRHDPSRGRNDEGIAELKRQITGLEVKLNKILDLINPPMPAKKAVVTEEVKILKPAKKATPKKSVVKKTVKKAAKTNPKKVVVKKVVKKVTKKTAVKKK